MNHRQHDTSAIPEKHRPYFEYLNDKVAQAYSAEHKPIKIRPGQYLVFDGANLYEIEYQQRRWFVTEHWTQEYCNDYQTLTQAIDR